MPSGVGARGRVVRVVSAVAVAVGALTVLAPPTQAQQAPGVTIEKVAIGGDVTATFEVTGPGIEGVASLSASAQGDGPPAVAGPPIGFPLTIGATYTITEIEPQEGISPFELISIECTDGTEVLGGNRTVQVTLTQENPNITCTFTNALTRAAILGLKVVSGPTSSWTRPARFHITCPDIQLDIDIEPPVGPGGPGTYIIGQGSIPPATCTISEIDTGSDAFVFVSMEVTNHGVPIASGSTSVTFTSHAGDDLVLRVTNLFFAALPGQPGQEPGATTTVAGGATTTTTAATTTTATTVPGGGTTTVPGGGGTTVPGSGGTTVPGGGAAATPAPATTAPQLPVTGSLAGGLIVLALVAMIGGLTLVARTRRLVD